MLVKEKIRLFMRTTATTIRTELVKSSEIGRATTIPPRIKTEKKTKTKPKLFKQ